MNKRINSFFLLLIFGLSGFTYFQPGAFPSVLEGQWKRVGKEQYEYWEKTNEHELTGYSMIIKDGEKRVTENLVIRLDEDQILYEANVPDQNEGKTIQFVLRPGNDDLYSFENPDHDFPNKIQYLILSSDSIQVKVSGKDGRGFSYVQTRVKN